MLHRTTIKDIAKEAGVSISLVSFVMNNQIKDGGKGKAYRVSEKTAHKIMKIAKELEYRPNNAARSLRKGKTNTIGVVVTDISNSFFSDICRYIEDATYKLYYTVFFGSSDENHDKFNNIVNALISRGVDGLIVVPCEKSEKTIAKIIEAKIPLVLLDRDVKGFEVNCVLLDNRKAGYLATDSLIRKGCRKIEMISYAMQLSNIQDRVAGYKAALMENGMEASINIHHVSFKNISAQIDKAIDEILKRDADGIVFATNTLTLEGIRRLRRVSPDALKHIRLVAFDESDSFDLIDYNVPYIKQPTELFGLESVRILFDNIANDKQQFVNVTLDPQFIEKKNNVL